MANSEASKTGGSQEIEKEEHPRRVGTEEDKAEVQGKEDYYGFRIKNRCQDLCFSSILCRVWFTCYLVSFISHLFDAFLDSNVTLYICRFTMGNQHFIHVSHNQPSEFLFRDSYLNIWPKALRTWNVTIIFLGCALKGQGWNNCRKPLGRNSPHKCVPSTGSGFNGRCVAKTAIQSTKKNPKKQSGVFIHSFMTIHTC